MILNNLQTHGALVTNANYKVTIISLPKCTMDLNTGKKCLTDLLGNNCSHTTLVHMSLDFIKDLLTLSTNNAETDGLNPAFHFSTRREKRSLASQTKW